MLAGGLGIAALLRRRRQTALPAAEPDTSLAEELRAKIADSKAAEAAAEPVPSDSDLEARRREVRERARGSIDELS